VFSLKGNQGNLHDDVKTFFTSSLSPVVASVSYKGGHGRIETRSIRATADTAWLQGRHDWKGLQSIIAITSKREIGDKVTEETRYFISSLDASDPKRLERVVRSHWAIENNLHWVLDIAFDEDSNRTRKGHSAANLSVIRHITLNLIKTEKNIQSRRQDQAIKGWLGQ
jgi:predicted transposase YbfD/YdcC